MSHTGCAKFLLWETVERLLTQTAILYQQRACVNSVGPPYRRLDQESKPTPVDTTTYDRMNRHGSLSRAFLHAASSSPQVIGGARMLRIAWGTFGIGGAKRGPGALTSGSSPGPCAAGQLRSPSFLPQQHRGGRGRAWSESPGRKPEQDLPRTRAQAACAQGLLLRTLLCDPT